MPRRTLPRRTARGSSDAGTRSAIAQRWDRATTIEAWLPAVVWAWRPASRCCWRDLPAAVARATAAARVCAAARVAVAGGGPSILQAGWDWTSRFGWSNRRWSTRRASSGRAPGDSAASRCASPACRSARSRRCSHTSSPISGAATTAWTWCKRWRRRCCSFTPAYGGCRRGFGKRGNTVPTTWQWRCAGSRWPMRPRWRSWPRGGPAAWRCRSVRPTGRCSRESAGCLAPRGACAAVRSAGWPLWPVAWCSRPDSSFTSQPGQGTAPRRGPCRDCRAASQSRPSLPAGTGLTRNTDHFEICYQPELDLHAERAALEAEHAYERVSSDLRHNLAFRVPSRPVPNRSELAAERARHESGQGSLASVDGAAGDRILFAVDRPADQWLGLITPRSRAHLRVRHPSRGWLRPHWISRGARRDPTRRLGSEPTSPRFARPFAPTPCPRSANWRAADGTSVPTTEPGDRARRVRLHRVALGPPASGSSCSALRQTARDGGDPSTCALQTRRDEFERAAQSLLPRKARPRPRHHPSLNRLEHDADGSVSRGTIAGASEHRVALGSHASSYQYPSEGGSATFGIECCDPKPHALSIRSLKPGDHIVVTGAPARPPAAQRMALGSLERPADGMRWPPALR